MTDHRTHEEACPDRPHAHELFRAGRTDTGDRVLICWATRLGGFREIKRWPITAAGVSAAAAWAVDARPTWLGSGHPVAPDDVVLLLRAVT